ncbi:MAG: hypothetical protein H6618_04480 [Deltaproteobacteria bacterium]|nr:hypothetical protein [Deltaproteobacteria bacterium]
MRVQLRNNKDGSHYYSFLYFDTDLNKMVRLSKGYIRKRFGKDITTEEEAKMAIGVLNAEYETMRQKIEKRAQWENKYYNFRGIVESYTKYQTKNAPNSYKNNLHYLRHYVLHYFLTIADCNNIDFWPNIYDEFRHWLDHDAMLIKTPGRSISYGAKNHCIKALNTFIRHLYNTKIVQHLTLCPKFPAHLLGERTVDDVITPDEMEQVYKHLKKKGHIQEAVFYRFLYFTGMRFNEGLGVSLGDIFPGQVHEPSFMASLLDRYKIKYKGYVVLSSQPHHPTRGLRLPDGTIPRKPLKGRKKISERNSRICVIPDEQLWSDIIRLYNEQVRSHREREHGADASNYPIFYCIDKSSSLRKLKKTYEALGLRYRSWHCCRHSCATYLIGLAPDRLLVGTWLGHSTESVIDRYLHAHQALIRGSAQPKDSKGEFAELDSDPDSD